MHRLLREALPAHLGARLPLRRPGRRALRRVQHLHGREAPLLEAVQRIRLAPRQPQEGISRIQLSTAPGEMALRVSSQFESDLLRTQTGIHVFLIILRFPS